MKVNMLFIAECLLPSFFRGFDIFFNLELYLFDHYYTAGKSLRPQLFGQSAGYVFTMATMARRVFVNALNCCRFLIYSQ